MAAKLKLTPAPTFKAKVDIPVHGAESSPVEFTFAHRDRTAMKEFMGSREGKTDLESVMEMAKGWDLEEEFTAANVKELLENYMGAPMAIYTKYVEEIVKVKRGN